MKNQKFLAWTVCMDRHVTCDSLHDNRCKQTNPAGALNGAADQSTRNAE